MKVFAVIPRAGVGNRLLVWAKALVFSNINQCPLFIIGINKLHIGPLIRQENSKRFYLGSFKFNGILKSYYEFLTIKKNEIIYEPPIQKYNNLKNNVVIIFNQIPSWKDYFDQIRNYRSFIKNELFKIISNKVYNIYIQTPAPEIGVHIRMGDFKKVKSLKELSKVGLARTPLDYYINLINEIRIKKGENTQVKIFSDGYNQELAEILRLKNVERFNSGNDMADMLVLSKSKIIITSMGSTFSYWAAFLSDADVINNPLDVHPILRNENNLFEGTLEYLYKQNSNTNFNK